MILNQTEHLFIFFCHDRPSVLERCLKSFKLSFPNGKLPDKSLVVFYKDGITEAANTVLNKFLDDPFFGNQQIFTHTEGRGYSTTFNYAYQFTKIVNPKYVFFIETDYVFRNEFYRDCLDALRVTEVIGVPGTSHPDFVNPKKSIEGYAIVMKDLFGEDIPNRQQIYSPVVLDLSDRKLLLQYGTNACCCFLLNWRKTLKTIKIEDLDELINEASPQDNYRRSTPNDGMITGGISLLYSKSVGATPETKTSAFIDILNPPIAIHVAGQGVNSKYAPENSCPEPPIYWIKEYNLA